MEISGLSELSPEGKTQDILVIGAGGAGARVIRQLSQIREHAVRSIAIDRDPEILANISPAIPFLLKSSYFAEPFGLCGGDPDLVDRVADASRRALPDLDPFLGHPEFCFIVAGMGGNTGTGVLPVLAKTLMDRGTVVTAIVTSPFSIERGRSRQARMETEALRINVHSLIVLDLNRLNSILSPGLPMGNHFAYMDQFLADTIHSICETTHPNSFMPFGATDLHIILGQGSTGTIVTGEYNNEAAVTPSPEAKLQYAFGDIIDDEVTQCLIQIIGGKDMGLHEADFLANSLIGTFNTHADIVWGACVKKKMKERVRWIMLVMKTTSGSNRESNPGATIPDT